MREFLATLRRRPAPLIGTFVALAMAALLVTVTTIFIGTGLTLSAPAQRLAGTVGQLRPLDDFVDAFFHGAHGFVRFALNGLDQRGDFLGRFRRAHGQPFDFLGSVSGPLGDDLDIVIRHVGVGFDGKLMKRNRAPAK